MNIISGKEKTYQAWNGILQDDLKNSRTYNSAGTEKPGTPYENETDNYQQDHYQLFFITSSTIILLSIPQFFLHVAKAIMNNIKPTNHFQSMDYPTPSLVQIRLAKQILCDNYGWTIIFMETFYPCNIIIKICRQL